MKGIFIISIYFISIGWATAQSDSTKSKLLMLNEVEITATSNRNKSLLYQPLSVIKLNETELKRGNGLYLDDAINQNVPGVFMQRRSISGGQYFNIRGYGNGFGGFKLGSNFDGQGTKVYLNGIPITDAEGISVMDDIDFNSVGNVEVVKGPSGTLYGLAIAGVVNLQMQKAEQGKVSIGQDVMFGSYGLSRLTSHVLIGGERSSILINYGHQSNDGFAIHTASHKDFVNVVGEFQPNNKQTINTYFGYSNSYDERQGELTILQYDTLDYSGNPRYIKNDAHSNVISFRAGVGSTYHFNEKLSNTTTVFGSGVSNNASSASGWTDKSPLNFGARTTFDMHYALNDQYTLTGIAGGEIQHQDAQSIGYNMIAAADPTAYNIIGAMKSNVFTKTQTSSLFTEWTLGMPHDLSLTAGIGLSNMSIDLNDRFYVANNTNPTSFGKTYNNLVSPHFALNKVFNNKMSAYVSYSVGYKAPVSSYFYIPAVGTVDNGLVPEKGSQFEIGTKGNLLNGKLEYQLAVFNAKFTNKFTNIAVPLDTPAVGTAYTYAVNRGSQDNNGLELLLKYTAYQSATGFFTSVRPFVNLTYSDFKYKDYSFQALSSDKKSVVNYDYSGLAVAGVAPLTANAGLDFNTKYGIYGNVNYSYRDAMPFTSDGVNKTDSYGVLNAKLGIQHSFGHFSFDVYASAVNITNTQYSYMVFVNQLPDAYIPAPNKINYFGGANLKYTF